MYVTWLTMACFLHSEGVYAFSAIESFCNVFLFRLLTFWDNIYFYFSDNPAVWAGLMAACQAEYTASCLNKAQAKCPEFNVKFLASVKSKSKYPL